MSKPKPITRTTRQNMQIPIIHQLNFTPTRIQNTGSSYFHKLLIKIFHRNSNSSPQIQIKHLN